MPDDIEVHEYELDSAELQRYLSGLIGMALVEDTLH
jgi:hypothetical protein